mmetsp:Transcript_10693/g.33238  ORF Transcript_10693/g.33238 Transcript_10693/m.33238 type:complete len:281 (-) Transcript_10693:61-903(-)
MARPRADALTLRLPCAWPRTEARLATKTAQATGGRRAPSGCRAWTAESQLQSCASSVAVNFHRQAGCLTSNHTARRRFLRSTRGAGTRASACRRSASRRALCVPHLRNRDRPACPSYNGASCPRGLDFNAKVQDWGSHCSGHPSCEALSLPWRCPFMDDSTPERQPHLRIWSAPESDWVRALGGTRARCLQGCKQARSVKASHSGSGRGVSAVWPASHSATPAFAQCGWCGQSRCSGFLRSLAFRWRVQGWGCRHVHLLPLMQVQVDGNLSWLQQLQGAA